MICMACLIKQDPTSIPTKGMKDSISSPLSITPTTTSIRIAISTQNVMTKFGMRFSLAIRIRVSISRYAFYES